MGGFVGKVRPLGRTARSSRAAVFAGRRKTGILTFRDDPLIVAVEVPWEAIRRKGARFSMRDRVT